MPPNTTNVPFKAGLKGITKAFEHYEKQQRGLWKERGRQFEAEKRHRRKEMREFARAHKDKLSAIKKENKARADHWGKEKQAQKRTETFERKVDNRNRRRRRQLHRDRRTFGQRLRGGMGRAALFAGGGILGMFIGAALKGYSNYMQAQQSFRPSIGLGVNVGQAANRGARGGNLGFNIMQRAQLIPQMARSTGQTNPRLMMEAMVATAMGAGEVGGVFSGIRQAGTGFAGGRGEGAKEFERIMAAAVASGLERGRMPEFFQGVTSLLKQQTDMQAGRVRSGGLATLGALLGQTGRAGFQGQRGMNLLSRLQGGILNPRGDMNNAFIQQAMGFGRPGGINYFQAEMRREEGLTVENFQRVMSEVQRQSMDRETQALRMREVFGIGLSQALELLSMSSNPQALAQRISDVRNQTLEGPELEKEAHKQMVIAGTALERIAGKFDRSVGVGARAAAAIEKIEDMQYKLFEKMVSFLSRIAPAVERMADGLQWLGQKVIVPALKAIFPKAGEVLKGIGEYGDVTARASAITKKAAFEQKEIAAAASQGRAAAVRAWGGAHNPQAQLAADKAQEFAQAAARRAYGAATRAGKNYAQAKAAAAAASGRVWKAWSKKPVAEAASENVPLAPSAPIPDAGDYDFEHRHPTFETPHQKRMRREREKIKEDAKKSSSVQSVNEVRVSVVSPAGHDISHGPWNVVNGRSGTA